MMEFFVLLLPVQMNLIVKSMMAYMQPGWKDAGKAISTRIRILL